MDLRSKLAILADAAKYDASCASSGARRSGNGKGLGSNEGTGICHSYTPDGRCVSLLKILLTNHCVYDCRFCVNRVTSDIPRKAVPGASPELIEEAGRWADRLSANIELPTQSDLDQLAPEKKRPVIETTMAQIRECRDEATTARKESPKAQRFGLHESKRYRTPHSQIP